MQEIIVDVNGLRKNVESLEKLNEKFKRGVANLRDAEVQLRGTWEGGTKNDFEQAFRTDMNLLEEFGTAINKYIIALNEIAYTYEKAENETMQIATEHPH